MADPHTGDPYRPQQSATRRFRLDPAAYRKAATRTALRRVALIAAVFLPLVVALRAAAGIAGTALASRSLA
jgi:hypothetical protein